MDAQTLAEVMGNQPNVDYPGLLPGYENAMIAADINNTNRAAMWAAQLGHESVGLLHMEEIASGEAYEGRADLGNIHPGDGVRYKGSGPIQLTGRANFRAFTQWANAEGHTDIDFEVQPHLVRENPKWGFLAATYYWTVSRPNINPMSDAGDLEGVTRAINGGTNGIADRRNRWNRALPMGDRLLPSGSPAPDKKPHEFLMNYSRDNVSQLTPWNCGPASTETTIQAATEEWVPETQLAQELGTHQGGTDWIGQFPDVLNRHIPGGQYQHTEMPNDPPTTEQKERLWENLTASLDAGHPVVANIVAPPSNYPRSVHPSTIDLAYGGGTIYHYVALMGYAGEGSNRRVWWADSGFAPFGAWIGFDQTASLIPPKGYAWSAAPPVHNTEEEGEITVAQADRIIQELKDYIDIRITNPIGSDVKDIREQLTGGRNAGEYPGHAQLGQDHLGRDLTLVDGVAAARQDNARLQNTVDEKEAK